MVLNEGLEALGTDEYFDGEMYHGVFEDSAVKRVGLPRTLKRIEYCSFKNCKSLNSIKFPAGLETIGLYAFNGSGLESVVMPKSVRTIHQGTFSDCQALRKAVLNEGLETLGTNEYSAKDYPLSGVFEHSALTVIELPTTLRIIEYGAFKSCKNLADIQLPGGLKSIKRYCFCKSGLEKIAFPSSMKEVGASAFMECKKLKNVCLNEGLEKLGATETIDKRKWEGGVFADSAVWAINIPSTVRRLETETFNGCRNLIGIEIPNGIEYIGQRCF